MPASPIRAAGLLALLGALLCCGLARAQAPAPPPAGPHKVEVGAFVLSIRELDLKAGTYRGDFYLWFRWTGELSPASFEVMNGSDTVRERNFFSEHGGVKYAVYRVQSTLHTNFRFRRHPLDSHTLVIEIEDGKSDLNEMEYVPDVRGTRIQPGMALSGWDLGTAGCRVVRWTYPTNYGDPATDPNYQATYSRFVVEIPVTHELAAAYLKSFLPLFISVAIALLALFVGPTELEVRVGVGVAGIFGAVSSYLVMSGSIPETPEFTLADQIHVSGMFLILLTLAESCLVFRLSRDEESPAAVRVDRWARWILPLGYALLVLILTLLVLT